MALLSVIRRWALRDRVSIRAISRRTGLSRNTIRKYYGMTSLAYFLGNSLGPISDGAVAAFVGLPWPFVLTTVLLLAGLVWVAVALPRWTAG